MRVDIKAGGDGVVCWNRDAIQAYATAVDEREVHISRNNADVVTIPGLVKCYGCEVMEYDLGTRCTAVLTHTRYGVEGEIQPRTEDAAGSLASIPGLLTRVSPAEAEASPAVAVSPLPGSPRPTPSSPNPASHPAAPKPSGSGPREASASAGGGTTSSSQSSDEDSRAGRANAPEPKRSGLRGLFGRDR